MCRYHLYMNLTETPEGSVSPPKIKPVFKHTMPWELPETCALDVAARGPHNLEEIGELTNVTRERVRQIQDQALKELGEEFRDLWRRFFTED